MISAPDVPRGRLIFLVGVRRSGTNWLHRLISTHPDVVAVPSETHLFSDGIRHLQDRVRHGLISTPATGATYMDREEFLAAVRSFCDALFSGIADKLDPSASRILERTPMHVFHLPLISAVYPEAKVVHIIRDGRDVARSLVSQSWGPPGIGQAAEEWRAGITAARQAELPSKGYREVRYESLMAEPVQTMADLFGFLELSSGDEILDAVAHEAPITTKVGALFPTPGSGQWRTSWSRADVATFDAVAGDLLSTLGYEAAATRPALAAPRSVQMRHAGRRLIGSARPLRKTKAVPDESLDAAQNTIDVFFDSLALGLVTKAVSLLAATADVSFSGSGESWTASGSGTASRLAEALRSDPIGWKERPLKEEIISGDQFVIFSLHAAPDGTRVQRVYIVCVAGGAITRFHYRRFSIELESDSPSKPTRAPA
ncbi:MAG: sulfotransferase family protein [Acidimicrobiales bacterium]